MAKDSQSEEIRPETIPVREAHRFDTKRLAQLVGDRLGQKLVDIRQMRGGQSNPTFLIVTDTSEYVLRKQPSGELLPSAHAIDREYRVLEALSKTNVPVPKPSLYCAEREVIGTPFYLMERLRGRIFWSPKLLELPRQARAAVYEGMNDALARLHKVDWRAIGLGDFGRPGNYFARQIARWSKQWSILPTRDNPAIDRLVEWLPLNVPQSDVTTICHGDFRLDNMMFHPEEPRVIGILDWELSTLGHPLADLAYNCLPYVVPPSLPNGMFGIDLEELGIPGPERYLSAYAERTGLREAVTHFHLAFSLFRLAVILEGVLARAKAGNASSADAAGVGARSVVLAERGWQFASGG